MSICKLGQKNQITIPKEVTKELHLHPGDILEIKKQGSVIVLLPKKEVPAEQAWSWEKEWQEKEKEADEDIREGRLSKSFETADELIKHLKRQKNED
ncbi:MAG: AbrB/MazE/SpoVT family DNA-binding domain-containing protein [bacterium]